MFKVLTAFALFATSLTAVAATSRPSTDEVTALICQAAVSEYANQMRRERAVEQWVTCANNATKPYFINDAAGGYYGIAVPAKKAGGAIACTARLKKDARTKTWSASSLECQLAFRK